MNVKFQFNCTNQNVKMGMLAYSIKLDGKRKNKKKITKRLVGSIYTTNSIIEIKSKLIIDVWTEMNEGCRGRHRLAFRERSGGGSDLSEYPLYPHMSILFSLTSRSPTMQQGWTELHCTGCIQRLNWFTTTYGHICVKLFSLRNICIRSTRGFSRQNI